MTLVFAGVLAMSASAAPQGARLVRENGYDGCIELSNVVTRVVLDPNLGGRVLRYQLEGAEVLFQDPSEDGVIYQPGGRSVLPSAGRFDIGPETTLPRHPTLYVGRWTGEITGDRAARLTSQRDPALDLVLTREFKLAAQGSHLVCTQTIRNVGRESRRVFHWSRTLAAPGGICFVPLNSRSRYPQGYAVYAPGSRSGRVGAAIDFRPESEPNIRVREGLLEFLGPPANPKYAIDPDAGWMAYLTRNHLLFVKKFPVYPDRVYGEIAANSACIYYHPKFCELEPIGPVEELAPGQSASFTEEWWLHEFAFPEDRQSNLAAVRARVAASVARATDSPEPASTKSREAKKAP
ncbi:MAG: hypothetical protein ACREF9_00070 [Opitutaceae bacterium]